MKLSKIFIIVSFILFLGGGTQFLIMLKGEEDYSLVTGDLTSQVIFFIVYLVTFFLLISSKLISSKRISLEITKNYWFWIFLVWVSISFIWSSAPEVTVRQVVALLGTTLFSIYLINFLDLDEFIQLIAMSLFIINIFCYLIIILIPDIGIMHLVSNEWRGIFTHKNILGRTEALSIINFSYLLLTSRKGKMIWFFGLLSSVGLLIGSQSISGIVISIFIVIIIFIFYILQNPSRLIWLAYFGLLLIAVFFIIPNPLSRTLRNPLTIPTQILDSVNKDTTLTGRTLIWEYSLYKASEKPLLGYGYGAFWLGSNGPSADIWIGISTIIDHSHNGFIEIFLELGGIGLLLIIFVYGNAIRKSIQLFFKKKFKFQYSIYIIYLLFILCSNITENSLLLRNSIFWVIFTSLIFYQSKTQNLI